MRTLKLTSPLTKGPVVREAQKALKDYGCWVGKIDGAFGEMTARATTQARYMLGYRMGNVKPVYDDGLHNFLTGRKKPTILMQRRAEARRKKSNAPMRETALRTAKTYLGVKESPANSNICRFSQWYGMIGPWCAMFVTFCYVEADSKAFVKGERWAYCPYMLADARAQRNGLTVVPANEVQPGDVVLFDWKGDGVPDHVGIVEVPPRAGIFQSIEGNTSPTSDSNGGEVMRRERNVSSVSAFVRVLR